MTVLDELRAHFRESTLPRLVEMRQQLDALQRDPADASSLDGLYRHFHALAGLGASYGFPQISQLADEGEGAALALVRSGVAPPEELLRRWAELLDAIGRDLG